MSDYTYTIFDASPQSSSGTAWPSHQDVEIEADSEADAVYDVSEVMSVEAAGLNTSDGYEVGQLLHAIVWAKDGTIIGTPTYELTNEDLGVATEEERLARAVKHIEATELSNDRWAHYAHETGRWHVVDTSTLAQLCDYLESDGGYSLWCAETDSEEMPEGWTPDNEAP